MQHIHTPALHFESHNNLWRTVIYVSLAVAALVAIIEHSPAFLALLAVTVGLVLALTERMKIPANRSPLKQRGSASRLLGDGGSFPGSGPEQEMKVSARSSVLDGGSLEHHRS